MHNLKMRNLNYIIILFIVLNSCSTKEINLSDSLTRPVNKTIEYTFHNFSGNEKDTLKYVETLYNKNNLVSKRKDVIIVGEEIIETEIKYNKHNKIKKEIVVVQNDSFDINYYYQDTLLIKTNSHSITDEYEFIQKSIYNYDNSNKLESSELQRIYISLSEKDTIQNIKEIGFYANNNDKVNKLKSINILDSLKNKIIKYYYQNNLISKMDEYNYEDSLISTINYEYEFDQFSNWIVRKRIENKNMQFIVKREIDYK